MQQTTHMTYSYCLCTLWGIKTLCAKTIEYVLVRLYTARDICTPRHWYIRIRYKRQPWQQTDRLYKAPRSLLDFPLRYWWCVIVQKSLAFFSIWLDTHNARCFPPSSVVLPSILAMASTIRERMIASRSFQYSSIMIRCIAYRSTYHATSEIITSSHLTHRIFRFAAPERPR